jgi:hypothetical protein
MHTVLECFKTCECKVEAIYEKERSLHEETIGRKF